MPQDRSTDRSKKYEGQHSGENKIKMARAEDAWTRDPSHQAATNLRLRPHGHRSAAHLLNNAVSFH
jgi:hypothetical protein